MTLWPTPQDTDRHSDRFLAQHVSAKVPDLWAFTGTSSMIESTHL